uniref:Uncharacterized protein n=1 Tax=Paramoeba aestuarina TaxID=180227 RepID=A0A7S4NZT9_9EUKA|eukprot:CAMPEP_0201515416 /NCGR_PEP_ID=MMETSP0161_2-20130828/6989_1 /ASSEMBLY_ACC=CAM_ASM_000251 /TAXON_ID=180227 /ORGANISM="Neoparamoeba aestuarina, Strain SoJaBio B1-5/56/2" /LENGTH=92 /DNA_ID=CAMNT_0047912229 /DNA_START=54 /DNA_END=332 /DNA_ORIENTATION=+
MSGEENTIGARATEIANSRAKEWIDQAMPMVEKTVLALAGQGLYRATVRFEESLITDENNQQMMVKRLARENIHGEFKEIENGVELSLSWGK